MLALVCAGEQGLCMSLRCFALVRRQCIMILRLAQNLPANWFAGLMSERKPDQAEGAAGLEVAIRVCVGLASWLAWKPPHQPY
jgi:hypothetical protein